MNSGYISLVTADGTSKKLLIRVDSIDAVEEDSECATTLRVGPHIFFVRGSFDQIRSTVTQAGQLSSVMG